MDQAIKSYADLRPRLAEAAAGADKVLEVREFSKAQMDAFLPVVAMSVGLAGAALDTYNDILRRAAKAFVEEKERKEKGLPEEKSKFNLGEVAVAAFVQHKDKLLQVLAGGLTEVTTISLDTEKNRAAVGLAPVPNDIAEDKTHGYEYSKAMRKWVRENVTPRQEVEILKRVFEVNGFLELAKNYWSLVAAAMSAARAPETEPGKTKE